MTKENEMGKTATEAFTIVDQKLNAMNNFYAKNLSQLTVYSDMVKDIQLKINELVKLLIPKTETALELVAEEVKAAKPKKKRAVKKK